VLPLIFIATQLQLMHGKKLFQDYSMMYKRKFKLHFKHISSNAATIVSHFIIFTNLKFLFIHKKLRCHFILALDI